jgi:uncharacterized membrane protein
MSEERAPGGNLERILGRVLLMGVVVSTSLLAIGLALSVAAPSGRAGDYSLQAGLVVLMVTPAMRVLVSCAEYVRERDWAFAGLTGVVLAVLLGSLLMAVLK